MTDLKQLSALTALNNMMAGNYFNISTINSVADLLGVPARGCEAYAILHPLHCVDWGKMPPELREAVPGLIQQCLGISPAYQFKTARQEVIDVTPTVAKPRGAFLRLLGGGK